MAAPVLKRRLDSLTSLRAFAAFAVFTFHAEPLVFPGNRAVFHLVGQGSAGVSFFFILSGFVLTWSHRPGQTVRDFYRRRVARIVPAYMVACVLGVGLVLLEAPPHLGRTLVDIIPSFAFLQAWFPQPSVLYVGNSVGWSLSCEAFFYLLFPFILPRLMRLTARRQVQGLVVALAIAVLFPAFFRPGINSTGVAAWATYAFPVYRISEFIAGMLIALLLRAGYRCPVPARIAIPLAAFGYVVLAGLAPGWAKSTTVPDLFMALLIYAVASADLEGGMQQLRRPVLLKLGEWSYAFYLVHLLILEFIIKVALKHHQLGDAPMLLLAIAALGLGVFFSFLMFTFVERPLERRIRGDGTLPISADVESDALVGASAGEHR
jgi:peptidoglycan/LPS O-acetylase OafA/YrhL